MLKLGDEYDKSRSELNGSTSNDDFNARLRSSREEIKFPVLLKKFASSPGQRTLA